MLEQLFQDLNSFSETSIPFGDQSLDLKLFPFSGNPPDIHDWDVPIPLVDLEKMARDDWDLTMCKASSRSCYRIASDAD